MDIQLDMQVLLKIAIITGEYRDNFMENVLVRFFFTSCGVEVDGVEPT